MGQSPFRVSRLGKLEQLSTVEVRHGVLQQRDIRPGHTTAIPGQQGEITGWSSRYEDIHGRPKILSPHLARIQNTLDMDGQPRKPGGRVDTASTGEKAVRLTQGDRVPLPDIKDEKGHNLKNSVTLVRNRGS